MLRSRLRRLERAAEKELIHIPQLDRPPKKFPRSAYEEAFLCAMARLEGGEDAPPRHPLLEGAANSSDAK